jgi:hypothetical protein
MWPFFFSLPLARRLSDGYRRFYGYIELNAKKDGLLYPPKILGGNLFMIESRRAVSSCRNNRSIKCLDRPLLMVLLLS